MSKFFARIKQRNTGYRLLVPLMVLFVLLILNVIVDVVLMSKNPDARSFFSLGLAVDSYNNTLLRGDIINVLNSASELVILAIGMTLVTAVSGGQDISVGAVAAVAGSVFIKAAGSGEVTWGVIFTAFLACCLVAMLCGAFNGALVAVFRIQPMIATLVMFTAGRSIAYAINGNASPKLYDELTRQIGSYFPGVPIPSSIFLVIIYVIIFCLLFKFTNLRLYFETVGINEKSARLNGLNPVFLKLLAYIILGFCVAAAGFLNTCRMQRLDHMGILGGIEMDAILAVAIGGNALGGGTFSVAGSVIGAYSIEILGRTLLRIGIEPEPIKVYKALFIILLMCMSSPVIKRYLGKAWSSIGASLKKNAPAPKGGH